ncbi:MAG: UDP-3-O-(3-hydroxymyristoyl)glucosamine N-acyltransferase [Desulfobacterales bacterium]
MELALGKVATIVGGEVKGDDSKIVSGAAPFEDATEDDITYAGTPAFLKKLGETGAGAVIVPGSFEGSAENLICVDNPRAAFARISAYFHPPETMPAGVSKDAAIGENFQCGDGISIASHVSVGHHVTLGNRVTLYPGVVIGNHVSIGDDVTLYPNITIRSHCCIGSRVVIHAGTVIGSDGFGFAPDGDSYVKIPHTGMVQIDDDVEIGSVNTIDRATYGKTWIQRGVKTDNLIHVAHNVTIGENTVIAGQVGISGSVTIGKHVVMAGQAGTAGHLTIGDNATIGPRAAIYHSVAPDEMAFGEQMPYKLWLRVNRILPRLPELKKKITEMEKKLNTLWEKLN